MAKRKKAQAETFDQRMRRHHREFEQKFVEIAGRAPTRAERMRGYEMYYSDRHGPWEAASIVAEGRST